VPPSEILEAHVGRRKTLERSRAPAPKDTEKAAWVSTKLETVVIGQRCRGGSANLREYGDQQMDWLILTPLPWPPSETRAPPKIVGWRGPMREKCSPDRRAIFRLWKRRPQVLETVELFSILSARQISAAGLKPPLFHVLCVL
jgi:hypothetical protein